MGRLCADKSGQHGKRGRRDHDDGSTCVVVRRVGYARTTIFVSIGHGVLPKMHQPILVAAAEISGEEQSKKNKSKTGTRHSLVTGVSFGVGPKNNKYKNWATRRQISYTITPEGRKAGAVWHRTASPRRINKLDTWVGEPYNSCIFQHTGGFRAKRGNERICYDEPPVRFHLPISSRCGSTSWWTKKRSYLSFPPLPF